MTEWPKDKDIGTHYEAYLCGGMFHDDIIYENSNDRDAVECEVATYCNKLMHRLAFDDSVTMYECQTMALSHGWRASRTRRLGQWTLTKGEHAPKWEAESESEWY